MRAEFDRAFSSPAVPPAPDRARLLAIRVGGDPSRWRWTTCWPSTSIARSCRFPARQRRCSGSPASAARWRRCTTCAWCSATRRARRPAGWCWSAGADRPRVRRVRGPARRAVGAGAAARRPHRGGRAAISIVRAHAWPDSRRRHDSPVDRRRGGIGRGRRPTRGNHRERGAIADGPDVEPVDEPGDGPSWTFGRQVASGFAATLTLTIVIGAGRPMPCAAWSAPRTA